MVVRKKRPDSLTGYQMYTKKKYKKNLEAKGVAGELSEKERGELSRTRWELQHDQVLGTDDYETRNAPNYNKQPESSKSDPKKDKEFFDTIKRIGEDYERRRAVGRKK